MYTADLSRFFTVISSPRSGSNYLCGLIGSHRLVGCHNEIFHHQSIGISLPQLAHTDPLFNMAWRDANPHQFITHMVKETEIHTYVKFVGCKLLINEYQIERGLDAILDSGAPVIFLTRQNKLAYFSSSYIARQTGVWVSKEKSGSQPKITFNEADYWETINLQEKLENLVLSKIIQKGIRHYCLEYETLFNKKTLIDILDFLNIPRYRFFSIIPYRMQATTAKQNSKNLLDRFDNPNDVKGFLAAIGRSDWAMDI